MDKPEIQLKAETVGDDSGANKDTDVSNPSDHPEPKEGREKSKKGRPKGSVTANKIRSVKATRASIREKKVTKVMHYETEKKLHCQWTDYEKTQLMKGLEEYGHTNISALREYLPHKKDHEIRNQIRIWKEIAQQDLAKKLALENNKKDNAKVNNIMKLDRWLEHFEKQGYNKGPRLFALSQIFLLISEFAEFPPPEACHGLDFRAMYRYIHCMLNGEPFYGINQVTAKSIDQCISNMLARIREQNLMKEMQATLQETTPYPRPSCKTYSRGIEKIATKSRNPRNIWTFPDVNPLNITPSSLDKKWTTDNSSDDCDGNLEAT